MSGEDDTVHGQFPLVELHRHLEGSIRPEWILDIKRGYPSLDLPDDLETIRRISVAKGDEGSLTHIFLRFRPAILAMHNEKTIRLLTFKVCEEAKGEGVRFLEIRFSPSFIQKETGMAMERIVRSVQEGKRRAEEELGISVGLLLIITREYGPEAGKETMDIAIKTKGDIVGIDLAGEEKGFPPSLFRREFQRARDEGFHITIHSGEVEGAGNVADSILTLGAERIGHGIRAVEDEKTMKLLSERGIPLEFCPTSNLVTGVIGKLKDFPLPEVLGRGIKVTVNTDDPAIFDTTLKRELAHIREGYNLPPERCEAMMKDAWKASFIPSSIKERGVPIHWREGP